MREDGARTRIARVLELVNLVGLEQRYPSELSGGLSRANGAQRARLAHERDGGKN